jgi:hypothetical protein
MTPEERFERIEHNLDRLSERMDRHIEFVGATFIRLEENLTALTQQVNRTAAAQEVTEKRLQELIRHVDGIDGRVKKLEDEQ